MSLFAAFFEKRANGAGSQLGRVAIATQMSEDDALDFSRQAIPRSRVGRRRVRKMTVARLDSLFHRPGPMRIGLQKFLVVIVSMTSVCTSRNRSTTIFVA